MTTSVNACRTSQTRQSLAGQIDRLDHILDGLSDGLNEAVAMAVKEAVEIAVQSVLNEVLTNPEVMAKLHAKITPPASNQPRTSLKERMRKVLGGIGRKFSTTTQKCQAGARKAGNYLWSLWLRGWAKVQGVGGYVRLLVHFQYQLLLALGVGVVIGTLVYLAGPWLGTVVSGVGGFCTALSVQALLWFRSTFSGMISMAE